MSIAGYNSIKTRFTIHLNVASVDYAARDQRYRIIDRNEIGGGWLRIDFDELVGWMSATWVRVSGRAEKPPVWVDGN